MTREIVRLQEPRQLGSKRVAHLAVHEEYFNTDNSSNIYLFIYSVSKYIVYLCM